MYGEALTQSTAVKIDPRIDSTVKKGFMFLSVGFGDINGVQHTIYITPNWIMFD